MRRLHLGCGPLHFPGWVNVDAVDRSAADVVADAGLLPFADRSFARVDAHHLVEHLGYVGAIGALAEWFRVLEPGGLLCLETPDVDASFARFLETDDARVKAETLNWVFGHESRGQQHLFLFPYPVLAELLAGAGFVEVRREEPRTHGYAPGLRVSARRGDGPFHEALAGFRRELRVAGVLPLADQIEALELERELVAGLDDLYHGRLDAAAADDRVLEAIAFSAPVAAAWLRRDPRHGRWLPLAERQAAAGLQAQLRRACAARRLGHDEMLAEARELLRRGEDLRVPPDPELEPLLGTRGAPPVTFSRRFVDALAESLCAAGVRALARGEAARARRLLARSRSAYASWNLAVCEARAGDAEAAAARYRALLADAPVDLAGRLRAELEACLRGEPRREPVLPGAARGRSAGEEAGQEASERRATCSTRGRG